MAVDPERNTLVKLKTICILTIIIISMACGGKELRPNVVLLLIDTVNAEHLGCWGYHRNTSPHIDSLASAGTRYENCQAQAPWTLPGMTTILTGLSEKSHGCNRYGGFSHGLDPEVPTLATILSENGYNTAMFINNGYLGHDFGLNRNYDNFWMGTDSIDYADVTMDTVLNYMSALETDQPFLLTVHLFDPHLPYDPPAPFDTVFKSTGASGQTEWPSMDFCDIQAVIDHMCALYDSELLWTDSQLERLFGFLRDNGLSENTIVILVADHGEEFMEHGDWGHAHNLYQQSLHVPLIITGPGIPSGYVEEANVGQFDVLPTILDYLCLPAPDHIEGISLLAPFPEDRIIPSSGVLADTSSASCLQNRSKVLWFVETDSVETYDLEEDPLELNILNVDSMLLNEVENYWAWPCICSPTNFEEALIEQSRLEDLGYIR